MKNNNSQKTVFVGMSGGVDSSVAALRLKRAGFNVVGVFIKVWQPDFLNCHWEEERLDAMRVAAHLQIPFLTCDAEAEYKQFVGDYFVNEYKAGRTPNPDVMCNKYVKFGAFLKFAREKGADYVATGHYAQIKEENGKYHLLRGVDNNKDQSYFLWTFTQNGLSQTLFPIGDTPKDRIRQEAEQAGLPTAKKKDSQGVCFLGHIDIPEFMGNFVDLEPGAVLNKAGEKIGRHKGALVYTLGQRHGFTVNATGVATESHYVIAKDLTSNTITVDITPPDSEVKESIVIEQVSWTIDQPSLTDRLTAQFRYRQTPFAIELKQTDGVYSIIPETIIEKPSAGQSMVFYAGEECLGGGIVK